jgi:tRNA-splicing ligase RtcB
MTDNRRPDPFEARARALALAAGVDPDSRVPNAARPDRTMPAWASFRTQAQQQHNADLAAEMAAAMTPAAQPEVFRDAPLAVFGQHGEETLAQMRNCMAVGQVVGGVICADGHIGYAQPVGGVIAYEGQVSISGVGFDIGCGNMAARLDVRHEEIVPRARQILGDITRAVSFGVGRANATRAEHALLDDREAWRASGMDDYRQKAAAQLGTVGSGNHYVDLLRDEEGFVWIGVHFGSRGLGHTCATRYLKRAGGRDGINVPPAVVNEHSEVGAGYLAAMELAGRYAYAGREWVVERVRQIVGGTVTKTIHNHHNYAWRERHGGRDLWVVRKGATPAFPSQLGFVGGSMGDDAVILEGLDGPGAKAALYSTVHGAGRTGGSRTFMKRTLKREDMDAWLQRRGVLLAGGDLDESPQAYRRLPEVLAAHAGMVRVVHTLSPFAVAMAGPGEFDPWKD